MTRTGYGRICAVIAGFLLGSSGAYMLASPESWYASVPGVPLTGPFNEHFVIDVALAYLVSAIGLVVAGIRSDRTLAIQAASWPVAHGLFHLVHWFQDGLPDGLALPAELIGVIGFGALAATGAWALPPRAAA